MFIHGQYITLVYNWYTKFNVRVVTGMYTWLNSSQGKRLFLLNHVLLTTEELMIQTNLAVSVFIEQLKL